MLCFCRDHVIRYFLLFFALAGLGAVTLVAETINYGTDETLSATKVNTARFRSRALPLAELLTAVEKQTWLRFVYDTDRLPMGAEVALPPGSDETTLDRLLTEISSQVAVVFKRRSGLVAVWGKGPDDVVVDPVPASMVPATFANAVEPAATPETPVVVETPVPTEAPVATAPELSGFSEPTLPAASNEAEPPAGGTLQMEKFKVQGKAAPNSQAALREKAAVAVDMLTSRDFGKYIATDIADIVIRMPGFSTSTRGSFAVVRGLSERYNPIMLDGIVLPSSDPERQTPELDLFPIRLVDTVVVSKVFEPRLPATSSGGAVDLRTKPLPQGRAAQIQFGVRAAEGALEGEEFVRSDVIGLWDHFALGAKDRPGAPLTPAERITRTQDRDTNWSGQGGNFPLGTKFSALIEDRIELGGDGRAFGYSFSLGYDSEADSKEGRVFNVTGTIPFDSPGIALASGNLVGSVAGEDFREYEQEVRIGGLLTLGLAFNPNHTISFSGFLSQVGIDYSLSTFNGFNGLSVNTVAQLDLLYEAFATGKIDPKFSGVSGSEAALERSESVYYRQRNLTDLKVSGEHKFTTERAARIDWSVANIQASQDEPDFSYLGYSEYFPQQALNPKYFIEYGQPVRLPARFWREVAEKTWAGRVDGEMGFDLGWMTAATAKAGLYYDATKRSYDQEAYTLTGGPRSTGNSLEELVKNLQDANFGVGGRSFGTNPAFSDAERKIKAAYMSITLPLLADKAWAKKLDLLVGARFEAYQFTAAGRGTLGNAASADYYIQQSVRQKIGPEVVGPIADHPQNRVYTRSVDENTLHPSVALTWAPRDRFNVRLAYSRTVARPSFRELSPYFTNDEVTNEVQHGNIYLNTSKVENYDLRLEYFFPKSRDLVAVSVFTKKIDNPIEKSADVITGSGFTALGWFNNPNTAKLKGAEVEAAKNLGFLGETGSYFTVGGNATFIDAKVLASPGESLPPGTERNLFDQPEWIGNAYLTFDQRTWGFSTTVSWFTISDVLRSTAVGKWATYVAAHDRLDLTMTQRFGRQWQVRLSAKNLTDPDRKFIADPDVVTEEVVYRQFKDGRNYSLTATYDF